MSSNYSLAVSCRFGTFESSAELPKRKPFKQNAILLDLGTSTVKIRHLNSGSFKAVAPVLFKTQRKKVGQEAINVARRCKDFSELSTPLGAGFVENWELLERFLGEALCRKSKEAAFVLCEPVGNKGKEQRAELVKRIKRKFLGTAFYVAPQPVFALLTFGRSNGIVIDIGHSQTRVSVVFQGSTILPCTFKSPVAGKLLDEMLQKDLCMKLPSARDQYSMSKIKEIACFVSQNPSRDLKICEKDENSFVKEVVLEDGTSISLGKERFTVPEVLFNTSVTNTGYGEERSLIQLVKCAKQAYKKFRDERLLDGNSDYSSTAASRLSSQFCIVGGLTAMPGLMERLKTELIILCDSMADGVSNGRESLEEKKHRLGIEFLYKESKTERGTEAIDGAAVFAEQSNNRDWVFDYQLDEKRDPSYTVLFHKCPL